MTNSSTHSKTPRLIFIGFLILNFIIELVASTSILLNFPLAAEKGFGVTYSDELAVLGIGLGSNLALTTFVFLLGIIWTRRSKVEGVILGMAGSVMLLLFATLTFLQLGDPQGFLVDGIRGFITIVFGFITFRQLNQKK